jgi:hypothetical protein
MDRDAPDRQTEFKSRRREQGGAHRSVIFLSCSIGFQQ